MAGVAVETGERFKHAIEVRKREKRSKTDAIQENVCSECMPITKSDVLSFRSDNSASKTVLPGSVLFSRAVESVSFSHLINRLLQ